MISIIEDRSCANRGQHREKSTIMCNEKLICVYSNDEHKLSVASKCSLVQVSIEQEDERSYFANREVHFTPLLVQHDITILLVDERSELHRNHNREMPVTSRPQPRDQSGRHRLVAVDLANEEFLGLYTAPAKSGPDHVTHNTSPLDRFQASSVALSHSREFLTISLALVAEKTLFAVTSMPALCTYATKSRAIIHSTHTGYLVSSSATYSPVCPSELTYIYAPPASSDVILEICDVTSGCIISKKGLEEVGFDCDSLTQLSYARDGLAIALMICEPVWYSADLLARVYLLNSADLSVIIKYPTFLIRMCHFGCIFNAVPSVSRCNLIIHVPTMGAGGLSTKLEHLTMPRRMNLKALCRSRVWQVIKDQTSVDALPLPGAIKRYIRYAQT